MLLCRNRWNFIYFFLQYLFACGAAGEQVRDPCSRALNIKIATFAD